MNDLQIVRSADRGRRIWSLRILPIVLFTFDSTLLLFSYQTAFLNVFGNLFKQLVCYLKLNEDGIRPFEEKNKSMSLLRNIWIKVHFQLEMSCCDFG